MDELRKLVDSLVMEIARQQQAADDSRNQALQDLSDGIITSWNRYAGRVSKPV